MQYSSLVASFVGPYAYTNALQVQHELIMTSAALSLVLNSELKAARTQLTPPPTEQCVYRVTIEAGEAISGESMDHWPQQVNYSHVCVRVGRCHQTHASDVNACTPSHWSDLETGQTKDKLWCGVMEDLELSRPKSVVELPLLPRLAPGASWVSLWSVPNVPWIFPYFPAG